MSSHNYIHHYDFVECTVKIKMEIDKLSQIAKFDTV